MGLDLKHRPKTIDDIIGNRSILPLLAKMISGEEEMKTLLLFGPSGCGKTTIARILGEGSIKSKQDMYELNISDTRGIDAAREIINKVNYHTFSGGKRVVILNECHQSTKDFQNAMLEVLEEPPIDTIFILCTTEPAKLIEAVKTRCRMLQVAKLDYDESKELLKKVIKKERLKIPEELFRDIITTAEGIPRKLLLILESISGIKTKIECKAIIGQYGFIEGGESEELIEFCRNLARGVNVKIILKNLKKIKEPPETIKRSVCGYMAQVLLNKGFSPKIMNVLDCFMDADTSLGLPAIVFASVLVYTSAEE